MSFLKYDKKSIRQKNYIKLFVGFFVVMFLLTLLSRAADSLTVARVIVDKAKRGSLNYETVADGIIESSDKIYVKIEEGFKTEKINVNKGEFVKAGDTLIILDKKDIEEQLFKAETELELLKLKKQRLNLETYENEGDAAVEKAQIELNRAKRDSDINKEINKGIEMEKDKRAVEDAMLNLQSAEKEKEKINISNKASKGKNEIDKKSTELEILLKTNEINRLKDLCSNNNIILAESDGIIDEIYIKEGEKTTGSNLISIIPHKASCSFKAIIDAEKAKYIKIDDAIQITLQGKQIPINDVIIKSVIPINGGKNMVEITAEIPEGKEVSHGMRATMKHVHRTDEYNRIIPISALRSSSQGDYILVVKETNTVMGNEKSVYKLDVIVADKDSSFAVITSGINDEIIITNSNKSISEGDRVRIDEQ